MIPYGEGWVKILNSSGELGKGICTPIFKGGLGVCNLFVFNQIFGEMVVAISTRKGSFID